MALHVSYILATFANTKYLSIFFLFIMLLIALFLFQIMLSTLILN